MGKFKVGDRVRFLWDGYPHQPAGFEDTVRALDELGRAIASTDPADDDYGWPDGSLELASSSPEPSSAVTLRDQFAMAALTGLVSRGDVGVNPISVKAYKYADAMIEARK